MTQQRLVRALIWAAALLILAYLVLPIGIVVVMSFSDTRFLRFPPTSFSLRWYESYFGNSAWMTATYLSVLLAAATTALAVPIGTAAAYAANVSRSRVIRHLQLMLLTPVMVPIIVTAVGLYMVYAQIGLLATKTGVVLAHTMMALPYVFISVLAGLRSFDMTQEAVARSLGVNRFRAFMTITLPQIRPSVLTGAVFAFINSLDETVIALFISGGQNQTLPKRMFMNLRNEIDPTIAAISSVLIFTTFSLVILARLGSGKADAHA